MTDRYVVIHESQARARKLPGYEESSTWDRDSGWALFECDDAGTPVRLVFCDQMEPEDAILVRDLRPLVAELNRLASPAPSPRSEAEPEAPREVYFARWVASRPCECAPGRPPCFPCGARAVTGRAKEET